MKRIIVILGLIVLALSGIAGNGRLDFVVTQEGIYYFKNVRHTFSSFLVGIDNEGEITKFSENDIIIYTKNGKQFEKLPYYIQNIYVGEVFMELVKTENGFRIFKHETTDEKGNKFINFYLYKDKEFIKQVNQK